MLFGGVREPGSFYLKHSNQNAETLTSAAKTGLIRKAAKGENGRTNLKSTSPKARGGSNYGTRNEEADCSEARGAWEAWEVGKGDWEKVRSSPCCAGVTRLRSKGHGWTLAHAQLEGQWSHLVSTSSAELDAACSKFLESNSGEQFLVWATCFLENRQALK